MGLIKNIMGTAGKAVGIAIGGPVVFLGKKIGSETMQEVGHCAAVATAKTGETLGEAAEGAVEVAKGTINSDPAEVRRGAARVGNVATEVIEGAGAGLIHIAKASGETVQGVVNHDKEQTKRGAKKLLKAGAISALAIGVFEVFDGVDDMSDAITHDAHGVDFHHDVAAHAHDASVTEHYVNPHHVDGYVRHDGTPVDGYWRDGDGNTAVDLTAKVGGGYFQRG